LSSKKILVVEDSFDLRELLGIGLTALGWDPILAESGRESLAKLECGRPGVILMDMGLPDMNGFELAAILKRHRVYRRIPILGTSGYPGGLARERCLAAGCDDFIAKPFGFIPLQTRLTRLTVAMKHETLIGSRT
jgi:two-component system cell cycle response regulator DivK